MILSFFESGTMVQFFQRDDISPLVLILFVLCLVVAAWVVIYAILLLVTSLFKSFEKSFGKIIRRVTAKKVSKASIEVKTVTDVELHSAKDVETPRVINQVEPLVELDDVGELPVELREILMVSRAMASHSHKSYCEDAVHVDPANGFAVVLDGVSGSEPIRKGETGGKTASTEAMKHILRVMPIQFSDSEKIAEGLKEVMNAASSHLLEIGNGHIGTAGIICQILSESENNTGNLTAVIAHVGDCRAHIWNPQKGFEFCTIDHGLHFATGTKEERLALMRLVANGDEKLVSGNIILSSIGSKEYFFVDISTHQLLPGERMLITTDGLHENLFLPKLHELMLSSDNLDDVANLMMGDAYYHSAQKGGKKDDIGFVIIENPKKFEIDDEKVEAVKTKLKEPVLKTKVISPTSRDSSKSIPMHFFLFSLGIAILLIQWFKGWALKALNFYRHSAPRVKRIIEVSSVITLLTFLFVLYSISRMFIPEEAAQVLSHKGPLGITRSSMSNEELEIRKEEYFTTRGEFIIMRRLNEQEVPTRLAKYRKIITEAAKARNVDPGWLLGIADVESQYNPEAFNANVLGMFQLDTNTSQAEVLNNLDGDFRCIKGKQDFRKDPFSAALTTAELHRQAKQRWGDEALAVWDHHAGAKEDGVLVTALKYYLNESFPGWLEKHKSVSKAVREYKITFWDLYFKPTPVHLPKTYEYMQSLNTAKHDYTTGYVVNVASARRLALLSESNPQVYQQIFAKYAGVFKRFKFEKDIIPSEWWTYYEPKKPIAKTCSDLQAVVNSGLLVKPPNGSTRFGFELDRRDKDGIGWVNENVLLQQPAAEKDHNIAHRDLYKHTSMEVAGMLIFVAKHYQAAYAAINSGKRGKNLVVASLVRSEWSHQMLTAMGYPTTDQLPLHLYALAVDITKNGMSEADIKALMFALDDLRSAGYLSYSDERAAWHIVPNPDRKEFYQAEYQNHTR